MSQFEPRIRTNDYLPHIKLRPFVFTKSEKKPDPTSHPELEESKLLVEERYNTEPLESKTTGDTPCITPDEPCQREVTQEIRNPIRCNYGAPGCGETIEATIVGSFVTDSVTTDETVHECIGECMGDEKSFQAVAGEAILNRDPKPDLEFLRGVGSVSKRWPKPDLYGDNSTQNSESVEPEVARSMTTSQPNDTAPSCRGVDRKDDIQIANIEKAEDQDLGKLEHATAYPMISHLMENYKVLAEVMRLSAIHTDGLHETYPENNLNVRPEESKSNRTEREDDSGSPSPQLIVQLKLPLPQFSNTPGATIQGQIGPGSVSGKHIQKNDYIVDRLDSRFGTANTSSSTINSFGCTGKTLEHVNLPSVESLVDMPYDTLVCASEQVTPDKSRATLPPIGNFTAQDQGQIQTATEAPSDYCLDIAMVESPPHSSNDSFSVSDDSSLFSGSTKHELEKLQIEVKDHLEQAERQGGLLIVRWVGESGIKETIGEIEEEDGTNNTAENQNSDDEDDSEECENDERIEVFEFEYVDDCKDSGDEDGEIDQEMNKILAWIALEDAKAMQPTASQAMVKFDEGRIEEVGDTDNSDDEEGVETKDTKTTATRIFADKKLSVVDEEDDEDDVAEEGNKEEESVKAKGKEKAGGDGNDEGAGKRTIRGKEGKVEVEDKRTEAEGIIMGTKDDNMEIMGKPRDTEFEVKEEIIEITEEKSDNSVGTKL